MTARRAVLARVARRDPAARWAEVSALAALVDGAELLVNLAGRSVGCRYTDRNRNEIYRSRIDTTTELHDAVAAAASPPRLWMNASTATTYRHATDRPQPEQHGDIKMGHVATISAARHLLLHDPVVGPGDCRPPR